MDRRHFLGMIPPGIAWAMSSSVEPLLAASRKTASAALLVPLTGPSAALGLSMQRAASLVQPLDARAPGLAVFDTGGTPQGAAAAAALALKRGATFLLGPLYAGEVRAVVTAVGATVPVLSFSNDDSLRNDGAFLLGITAAQAVSAILSYARARGIRRVAVLDGPSPWTMQAGAAAQRLQSETGLVARPVASAGSVVLRAAFGGELPDALLVAEGGAVFTSAASQIRDSGVQLLGTLQADEPGNALAPGVRGAWIAAPNPVAFGNFAQDFEQRNGSAPGAIAALAYDGATIVKALQSSGQPSRAGLLRTAGFPSVTGALHFHEDGSASRQLSILIAGADGFDLAPA